MYTPPHTHTCKYKYVAAKTCEVLFIQIQMNYFLFLDPLNLLWKQNNLLYLTGPNFSQRESILGQEYSESVTGHTTSVVVLKTLN